MIGYFSKVRHIIEVLYHWRFVIAFAKTVQQKRMPGEGGGGGGGGFEEYH